MAVRITVNPLPAGVAGPGEKIVEFHSAELDKGGLISFREMEDGTLSVAVYRIDEGVIVQPGTSGF